MPIDQAVLTARLEANTAAAEKSIANMIDKFASNMATLEARNSAATQRYQANWRTAAEDSEESLSEFGKKAMEVTDVAVAGFSLAKLGEMADSWVELRERLDLYKGSLGSAESAQERLYEIAQSARVPIENLAMVLTAAARAGADMGASTDDVFAFTQAVAMASNTGSAGSEAMQASMSAIAVAVNEPVVQMRQLREVMKSTPELAKALADGVLGAGNSVEDLMNAIESKQISGSMLFAGLIKALPEIKDAFAETSPTIATMGTVFENAVKKFVGGSDDAIGASKQVIAILQAASNNVDLLAAGVLALATLMTGRFAGSALGAVAGRLAQFSDKVAGTRFTEEGNKSGEARDQQSEQDERRAAAERIASQAALNRARDEAIEAKAIRDTAAAELEARQATMARVGDAEMASPQSRLTASPIRQAASDAETQAANDLAAAEVRLAAATDGLMSAEERYGRTVLGSAQAIELRARDELDKTVKTLAAAEADVTAATEALARADAEVRLTEAVAAAAAGTEAETAAERQLSAARGVQAASAVVAEEAEVALTVAREANAAATVSYVGAQAAADAATIGTTIIAKSAGVAWTGLKTVMGGLLDFLGGPWGAVMVAAGVAVEYLIGRSAAAQEQLQKQREEQEKTNAAVELSASILREAATEAGNMATKEGLVADAHNQAATAANLAAEAEKGLLALRRQSMQQTLQEGITANQQKLTELQAKSASLATNTAMDPAKTMYGQYVTPDVEAGWQKQKTETDQQIAETQKILDQLTASSKALGQLQNLPGTSPPSGKPPGPTYTNEQLVSDIATSQGKIAAINARLDKQIAEINYAADHPDTAVDPTTKKPIIANQAARDAAIASARATAQTEIDTVNQKGVKQSQNAEDAELKAQKAIDQLFASSSDDILKMKNTLATLTLTDLSRANPFSPEEIEAANGAALGLKVTFDQIAKARVEAARQGLDPDQAVSQAEVGAAVGLADKLGSVRLAIVALRNDAKGDPANAAAFEREAKVLERYNGIAGITKKVIEDYAQAGQNAAKQAGNFSSMFNAGAGFDQPGGADAMFAQTIQSLDTMATETGSATQALALLYALKPPAGTDANEWADEIATAAAKIRASAVQGYDSGKRSTDPTIRAGQAHEYDMNSLYASSKDSFITSFNDAAKQFSLKPLQTKLTEMFEDAALKPIDKWIGSLFDNMWNGGLGKMLSGVMNAGGDATKAVSAAGQAGGDWLSKLVNSASGADTSLAKLGTTAAQQVTATTALTAFTVSVNEATAALAAMGASGGLQGSASGIISAGANLLGGGGGDIGSFGADYLSGAAGFDVGGYTGDAHPSKAVGVVHGQEYIFDAVATKRIGVRRLEAMRRGYGLPSKGYQSGGYVGVMPGSDDADAHPYLSAGMAAFATPAIPKAMAPSVNNAPVFSPTIHIGSVTKDALPGLQKQLSDLQSGFSSFARGEQSRVTGIVNNGVKRRTVRLPRK